MIRTIRGGLLSAALTAAALSAAAGVDARPSRARQPFDTPSASTLPDGPAYIPLAARNANVRVLTPPATALVPSRTPTLPATATSSPTTGPSPTESPSPTPTLPACVGSLDQRVAVTEITLESVRVHQPARSSFFTGRPIQLAIATDGRALVGYSGSDGTVRITPIDEQGQRDGPDWKLPRTDSIHGLVAMPDGATALVVRGSAMVLVRLRADGTTVFEKDLVGGTAQDETHKWIDDWTHEGRMIWTGDVLSTYFGHTSMRSNGRHQGDLLWHFDASGAAVAGDDVGYPDWEWGCSHSLDVRLAREPRSDRLAAVCLSDCYPGKGIYLNVGSLVSDEPSGNCGGHSDASLGGLVVLDDGFAVDYASRVNRASLDIAIVRVYEDDYVGAPIFLTSTPKVQESAPHLARYGDRLLAGWYAGSDLMAGVFDYGGRPIEEPVKIGANVFERDDWVNFANGDVGWAYTLTGGRKLWLARVKACE